MPFTVAKSFSFDAAHQLPLHDGKCRNLHGHTYRVQVTVTGPLINEGPKSGMVVDFGDLKDIWKEHLEPWLDHRYLNDSLPLEHTTAEAIAGWILGRFRTALEPSLNVTVRVYETPDSWAEAQ